MENYWLITRSRHRKPSISISMPRFSLFSICISSHYSPCLQQSFFSSNWKWFEVQLCVIQRKNEVPVVGQLVCHYWTLKNVHEDVHMQMCKCWWRKRDSHSMKPVVAAWPNSVVIHVIKEEENFHKVVHDASKSSSLIHSFRSLSTNPSLASSKISNPELIVQEMSLEREGNFPITAFESFLSRANSKKVNWRSFKCCCRSVGSWYG